MKQFALSIFVLILAYSPAVSQAQQEQPEPTVRTSVFHAKTKPIREMKVILPGEIQDRKKPEPIENPSLEDPSWPEDAKDRTFGDKPLANVQKSQGNRTLGAPIVNVEGLDNLQSVAPADPNGDVGLNYYIQTINRAFAVYDKQGNLVYGPVHNTSIWESMPGPWADVSWGGDPIFKFDQLAQRWVMSAFSINQADDQYYELVAVSTSPDPLGSYNLYAFKFDDFNDYPKLAIWHDAYYITYNMFRGGDRIAPRVTALDKDAMIAGEPEATMIEFEYFESLRHNIPYCTDIEGYNLSSDVPNIVLSPVANPESDPPFAALHLYEFKVDFEEPSSSSFEFLKELPLDGGLGGFHADVSQPGGIPPIDDLGFRLMYPVSYRDFGSHESIVACHSLRFPNSHFHKRWYELRRDTGSWYIHQSGSYLQDGVERWMGSINMNAKGDIALAYSASNNNIFPSIRYTGRLAGDSLNKMTIQEITAFPGEAPVNNVAGDRNRWGDYSSVSVDPIGDTTFWYTTMYPTEPSSQWGNWSTRIIAFNLRSAANNIVVEAGLDRLICEEDRIQTNGFAKNYSQVYWSTSGDGLFGDKEAVNTTYFLGEDDMETDKIVLTLHAVGYSPGAEITDSITVYRRNNPVADAGKDSTICKENVYMLQGTAEYADSIRWESQSPAGGTFTDVNDLNAIYTPSPFDKFRGFVNIELTAFNNSACDRIVDDMVRITLENCTAVDDPVSAGWTVDLHPNPVTDEFTVRVNTPGKNTFKLELYNTAGKKLFTGDYQSVNQQFKHSFDLSMQPAGQYFLRITNAKVNIAKPIIKR